jgi:hypothetical protein
MIREVVMKFLDITELQKHYASGDISSVTLFGVGDLFEIRLSTSVGPAKLVDGEEGVSRGFHDPREALILLSNAGIQQVDVDVAGWLPGLSSQAHDDWVQAKIRSSLIGLRDGSNRVFSAEEWAAIRAAKKTSRSVS